MTNTTPQPDHEALQRAYAQRRREWFRAVTGRYPTPTSKGRPSF